MAEEQSATDWLLDGWDAAANDDGTTDVPQPTLVETPEPEPETGDEEEGDEDEDGEDEVAAEGGDEDEEGDESEDGDEGEEAADEEALEALTVAGFDTTDPDVRAFLAMYDNDPYKAIQAAAHLRRAYDRQGTDLGLARQKTAELEQQFARARMLGGGAPLSEEQHNWAEGAAASAAPGAYVQQAIEAGEFDLARAVCSYWGRESPYEAARAGMVVDAEESRRTQVQQGPIQAPTEDIVEALKNNVPGFREWEPQMVAVFNNLGPGHHLVQESRSNDVHVAMRALMSIFEIAQASTASVQEQKTEIRKKARAEANGAKAKAAVTSGANSTSTARETSRRDVEIMPGLTLEDLDTEFAANS